MRKIETKKNTNVRTRRDKKTHEVNMENIKKKKAKRRKKKPKKTTRKTND